VKVGPSSRVVVLSGAGSSAREIQQVDRRHMTREYGRRIIVFIYLTHYLLVSSALKISG